MRGSVTESELISQAFQDATSGQASAAEQKDAIPRFRMIEDLLLAKQDWVHTYRTLSTFDEVDAEGSGFAKAYVLPNNVVDVVRIVNGDLIPSWVNEVSFEEALKGGYRIDDYNRQTPGPVPFIFRDSVLYVDQEPSIALIQIRPSVRDNTPWFNEVLRLMLSVWLSRTNSGMSDTARYRLKGELQDAEINAAMLNADADVTKRYFIALGVPNVEVEFILNWQRTRIGY